MVSHQNNSPFALNTKMLPCMGFACCFQKSQGGTLQSFIRRESAPRSNPYTFEYHFDEKGTSAFINLRTAGANPEHSERGSRVITPVMYMILQR